MANSMLTTIDNPWNPFTHYEEWNHFDTVVARHFTNQYLANVCYLSPFLSDADTELEIERAMDDIIKFQPFSSQYNNNELEKIWIKVTPEYYNTTTTT